MNGVLLRTVSVRAHPHSVIHASPRACLSVHNSVTGVFSGDRNGSACPSLSLYFDVGRRWASPVKAIRRALSEADVIRSASVDSLGFSTGSRPFREVVPEREHLIGGVGSLTLGTQRECYQAGDWPESRIPVEEELEFSGGGAGKGRKSCGRGGGDDNTFTGGSADWSKIGEYYQDKLKTDPTNSLLLRNYGRFLHEVVRDLAKAEEYYGRAILASPGDGEVLSLYGKLIWETKRDEERAKSYFDQAVRSSPNDCMVLGSYAHFMWEAEEEDDEGQCVGREDLSTTAAMIEAF